MQNLYCDLETFSPTLLRYGSHRYSEKSEILLFAYALGDGPVHVWDKTQDEMPADLASYLADPDIMTVWHNGGNFDTVILRAAGIDIPLERVTDTMIQAYQHGLPGALSTLCEAYKLPIDEAKDRDGKALIKLFCKPRPKRQLLRRATRETHPEHWARFVKYAANDIKAMRALHRRIPRWNCTTKEMTLWRLDQTINRRGVRVDMELAHGAIEAVELEKSLLADEAYRLTNGEVESATKRDQLLKHIVQSYGVTLPNMQASTLERRINDPDLPAPVRELLLIRLAATTSSTAKYKTLINSASSDGRLRGLLQFCGAARTGRWSGRIWQPQNLPRPTLKSDLIGEAISAFIGGYSDLICDDIMAAASSCLRGCIIASDGKILNVADLSNIEGRVLAWIAGEDWKLDAFRANDEGTGADLYCLAFAKSFARLVEQVTDAERQVGKVLELSMGFGGGVAALAAMAMAYGQNVDELAAQAGPEIPESVLQEADKMAYRLLNKNDGWNFNGLDPETWRVMDGLKRLWRAAHPKICQLWQDVEDAAKSIAQGVKSVNVNGLLFERSGAWMRIRLPSGRYLCYPSIRLENGQLSYFGTCPYSRKFKRLYTFGGKLIENIVQAIARDVLAENMPLIERAGFAILLTVHDEVITEVSCIAGNTVSLLCKLLADCPTWSPGLPLSAKGFAADRYRKD